MQRQPLQIGLLQFAPPPEMEQQAPRDGGQIGLGLGDLGRVAARRHLQEGL
ncbi:hypothetical protein WJ969_18715 [Achromobacter xylosoxidans]